MRVPLKIFSALHHPSTTFVVSAMGDPEVAPVVPIASHLGKFGVPKEIQDDMIKSGWTDALAWASTLKEEQLAAFFLREGSTYGPSATPGSTEDLPATCVGPVPRYSVRWPAAARARPLWSVCSGPSWAQGGPPYSAQEVWSSSRPSAP